MSLGTILLIVIALILAGGFSGLGGGPFRDHEVANLRESRIRADEDIQRQIDQLRQDHQNLAASLGNGGNSIQELKSEVSRLWDKLLEMNRKNSDAIHNRP